MNRTRLFIPLLRAESSLKKSGFKKNESRNKAFTLVEMLVVIAIIGLMATIAIPAITGPTASGRMNQNLVQLSGLLEEARQYALAQNTYVWVAFAPTSDVNGQKIISVALMAANDGLDPGGSSWASFSYTGPSSSSISQIAKITNLHLLSISDAGSSPFAKIPPATPVVTAANSLASNSIGYFSLTIPGSTGKLSYTQAVEFTPTGEARNGSNLVEAIDLDLQPVKGSGALDPNNLAVIRINGLTGESVVYRQ